ncbi:MAG: aldehyde ferredoxin oxidoreductase C-terminal domain-containing protein [Pseudomonadota bacterium]
MLLHEHTYQKGTVEHGYANRTLHIDVGTLAVTEKPVTEQMKAVFTGGKGFDLWLMWNSIPPRCAWDDPRNEVVIASGPMGGTPIYPGSGKSIVTAISPTTGSVMDSNVGGHFGPFLKFAGFDALEIQGKASVPMLVLIDGDEGRISFFDGSDLPDDAYTMSELLHERFAPERKQSVSVVNAGTGAKHSLLGCLNFSFWDRARDAMRYKQAGRGGIGSVFADKNIKAFVCKFSQAPRLELNAPADIEQVKNAGKAHSGEIRELDPKQNEMARLGTTHLVPIMNDYDLLPCCNFRYGNDDRAQALGPEVYRKKFHKGFDGCWIGCTVACAHCVKGFVLKSGPMQGQAVWVDGPEYETIAGCGSNNGIFDPDHVLEANFYCDAYGIDTISYGTAMAFAMECFEAGQITTEHTGGIELRFGNSDGALEVLHQLARGEGFGKIFGLGIRRMKAYFAEHFGADAAFLQDIGMESKGLEYSEYMTKESLAQQGGYGLALKGPQHDEAWLIFLDMVHNFMPTFEKKAEALHWFPMWRTWFGLNGLCKLPWNDIVPEDNKTNFNYNDLRWMVIDKDRYPQADPNWNDPAKVNKHLSWYAEFFSGTTGRQSSPKDLVAMSEKVYNFQRVFNLRQGFGLREHDAVPYRSVGPVTAWEYESRAERYDEQLRDKHGVDPTGKSTAEKMSILREQREAAYEGLKDAVYARRGWTRHGVITVQKARELGIDFPEVLELIGPYQD